MSSASSYPRCEVEIAPSLRLSLFVLIVFAAAVISPWFAGVPIFIAAALSVGAMPAIRPMWRWARGELARVVWQPEGRWQLVERGGRVHDEASLVRGIWIGSGVVALHWRCEECRRVFRAAFLKDNCDEDLLRRLRVRLNATSDDLLFGKVDSGA